MRDNAGRGRRLTGNVFWDLAIAMGAVGFLTGVVFPPMVIALGMPRAKALSLTFVVATVIAGLLVAAINYALVRVVVARRVRTLTNSMLQVSGNLRTAAYSGDGAECDADGCRVPVDSDDELGRSAAAFNGLVDALGDAHAIQASITSFSVTLSRHLDLVELAEAALTGLCTQSLAMAGGLYVVRDGDLRLVTSRGLRNPEELCQSPTLRRVVEAVQLQRVDLGPEVVVDSVVLGFRPSAVVLLPVRFNGVGLGVVVLACEQQPGRAREDLLDLLVQVLAVALNNALTHERFQRLAAVDSLTGLYNRRFGMERLTEEYARAIRMDAPISAVMFDIDHFKRVNDTYGHLVGDRVLKAVAAAARAELREGDVLARYGGEEFLAVLPGASSADAMAVSERIRRAVRDTQVTVADQVVAVSVSLGIVAYPETSVSGREELVARADEALYASKAQGRDRLTLAR